MALAKSSGIYGRILGFARPYRVSLGIAVIFLALAAAAESLAMYLVKPVMDEGFLNSDPAAARHTLSWVPLAVVAMMATKGLFNYLADIINNGVSNHVIKDLRLRLFDKLVALSIDYHSQQRLGQTVSSLTYDTHQMQRGVSDVVGRVVGSLLKILGLAGLIFWLNWKLALQIIFIFPLAMGPLYYFGRKIRRYSSQDQERMADLTAVGHEILAGLRVVLAFHRAEHERERFAKAVRSYFDAMMSKAKVAAASSPVMDTIGACAFALMIFMAGNHVIDGKMTFGDFSVIAASIAALYPHIKALNGVNVDIQNAMAAGQRIFETLDQHEAVTEKIGAKTLAKPVQGVRFEKVGFSYHPGHPVLSDVTFTLKPGKRIALVGPSGGGKSTLADLLARFRDPVFGAIRWDDCDLRDATLASLRQNLGVVTQDTFLFNESIAANIAYGKPEATRAEVEAAAKSANAHAFILEQPQGYETIVGERGVRLSGGQRQRLAIARALLKNPPVLILDEATSALDTQSERLVQEALDHLMEHRSTLVIAHRLSTVQHADEILVLDKGKVTERGKHAALLRKKGLYAKLFKMQFAKQAKRPVKSLKAA